MAATTSNTKRFTREEVAKVSLYEWDEFYSLLILGLLDW